MAQKTEMSAARPMSLDEQVGFLMKGTRYGDPDLERTMRDELRDRLVDARRSDRPLRVYCGFDPRTSDLHIGHTVPIRKLRAFQDLGHDVVFLVGTFTSLIGDPSDKDEARKRLTLKEALENGRTYAEQACQLLERSLTEVRFNHDWLSELTFEEVIELASHFTVQQFMNRDNFRKRKQIGEAIFLHETFYAVMQAYDAFVLDADVQIGGTDQLFNIVTASRKLMTELGKKPNIPIILDILPGTDGEQKMSKSLRNHIPILSPPEDMYGKVMSIPDKAMRSYFDLVTPLTPAEIDEVFRLLAKGELHPMNAKMRLAKEIVGVYHDNKEAEQAEEYFASVFRSGETPAEIPETVVSPGTNIVDLIVESGLETGRAEIRRLISQGAVRLGGIRITDHRTTVSQVSTATDEILRVGKRKFSRIAVRTSSEEAL